VPSQLAAQILVPLVAGRLLVEVQGEEVGYAPARPVEKISIENILCALRAGQGKELATADDPARAVVREQYERVLLAEMQVANAVNLRTLAARVLATPKSDDHSKEIAADGNN
jgi:DNA-binding IscR family transcriptional regulator